MIDAVRFPDVVGFVVNVTVRLVAVAAVTMPDVPLLKVTTFLDGTASKPNPLIVSVAEFAARFPLPAVITGVTVAT